MIHGEVTFHLPFPHLSWHWENSKDIPRREQLGWKNWAGNYKAQKDW